MFKKPPLDALRTANLSLGNTTRDEHRRQGSQGSFLIVGEQQGSSMASLQACAQEYLPFEPLPVASTLICFHWTSFLSQALWAAGLESWMGFGKLQATERHNAQKPLNTRCVVGGRRGLLRLVSSRPASRSLPDGQRITLPACPASR
jgi:hypothetical protein